jgi:hypothetical protein
MATRTVLRVSYLGTREATPPLLGALSADDLPVWVLLGMADDVRRLRQHDAVPCWIGSRDPGRWPAIRLKSG